jgi:thioredoxin-like negative regulator of GroEL
MRRKTNKTRKNIKTIKKQKVHFNPHVSVHKIERNNASQFDEKINNMTGPVLFHHPGCIHCVMMRPKWTQMIKELNNKNVNCKILEVNAEALPMIHHPLGKVEGFPRLINVENGVEKDVFTDERNVNNMLQFVLKHLKGKNNNLSYNYNLNKKGNIVKLTDPNNIKRVRKTKTRKNKKIKK